MTKRKWTLAIAITITAIVSAYGTTVFADDKDSSPKDSSPTVLEQIETSLGTLASTLGLPAPAPLEKHKMRDNLENIEAELAQIAAATTTLASQANACQASSAQLQQLMSMYQGLSLYVANFDLVVLPFLEAMKQANTPLPPGYTSIPVLPGVPPTDPLMTFDGTQIPSIPSTDANLFL